MTVFGEIANDPGDDNRALAVTCHEAGPNRGARPVVMLLSGGVHFRPQTAPRTRRIVHMIMMMLAPRQEQRNDYATDDG